MRAKGLLAAFLLAVGLYFVPALGYGEVREELDFSVLATEQYPTPYLKFFLLKGMVRYMMYNPTDFLNVNFEYDQFGGYGKGAHVPKGLDTNDLPPKNWSRYNVRVRIRKGGFGWSGEATDQMRSSID